MPVVAVVGERVKSKSRASRERGVCRECDVWRGAESCGTEPSRERRVYRERDVWRGAESSRVARSRVECEACIAM
jgi:hypothetical protein